MPISCTCQCQLKLEMSGEAGLFHQCADNFYIVVGRALGVWFPGTVSSVRLFTDNREATIEKLQLQHLYR